MKNWLKYYKDGSRIAIKYEPMFMPYSRKRKYATENPDIQIGGLWFNSVNGVEKVTNGTFDTDTTGWTAGANTTLSIDNGTLKVLSVGTGISYGFQAITTVVGQKYKLVISLAREQSANTGNIYLSSVGENLNDIANLNTGVGLYEFEFVAESTTTYLTLRNSNTTAGGYANFENASIFLTAIEPNAIYATQFSYLPAVVNLDGQGKPATLEYYYVPTLVEKAIMAERIVATEQRVMKEIGTIYTNKRYVIQHTEFFGDYTGNPEDYEAFVEVYHNGIWGKPEWLYETGASGVKAHSVKSGIVVQTGNSYVINHSLYIGSPFGTTNNLTNAPARVIVTYVGVTK